MEDIIKDFDTFFAKMHMNKPMKERDIKLLNLLRDYSSLDNDKRKEMEPIIRKTINRHREIERNSKIIDYYFSNYDISLSVESK